MHTQLRIALICALLLSLSAPVWAAELPKPTPQALKELAPTGTLRVGIAVGAAPSAFWAIKDAGSGAPRGVTVDLGNALARALGVPAAFVIYANSGEVTNAGPTGGWDVAFLPADAERRKVVDFGPAYTLVESTYLVVPGSPIATIAEVDRAGVRVAGIDNTTTIRSAERSLKNATLVRLRTVDEILEALRGRKADAAALSREALTGLAKQLPGARILDGSFHSYGTAVAVPKERAEALAYVSAFMEAAKTDGTVRAALDAVGLKDTAVAPAGR